MIWVEITEGLYTLGRTSLERPESEWPRHSKLRTLPGSKFWLCRATRETTRHKNLVMPQKRAQLERQIETAKEHLATWEKTLDERGVAADARKKEPKWRHLDANRRQLITRLRAVQAVEEREKAAAERKAAAAAE